MANEDNKLSSKEKVIPEKETHGKNHRTKESHSKKNLMKAPNSVRTSKTVHFPDKDATPGCPVCGKETEIQIERETSSLQAISSVILCLLCFPLIFPCVIPFCIDRCYDKKLICCECGAMIHRKRAVEIHEVDD